MSKLDIDSIAHSIVNVQPMSYSGQIFSMKPKYRNSITYRYLESSEQHVFDTMVDSSKYAEIYKWCEDTYGLAGEFCEQGTQWCAQYLKFTFFTKKEADIFALRWL